MPDYLDVDRFRNHHMMAAELELSKETAATLSESELIHLYDITFLVGRYDFILDSRRYRPSGTRNIKGQFPSTHSNNKRK